MLAINTAAKEVEGSQLRVAMLAKRAIINSQCQPGACLITANESEVFFANASNPAHGLRFTVEEWNAVVDFVDNQLLKQPVTWEPNWAEIPQQFNYCAIDDTGALYAYELKPYPSSSGAWHKDGFVQLIKHVASWPYHTHWTETLRTRPGVSL